MDKPFGMLVWFGCLEMVLIHKRDYIVKIESVVLIRDRESDMSGTGSKHVALLLVITLLLYVKCIIYT